MEIKAKLIKPYTDEQRIRFIVEYNHKQGCTIELTDTSIIAWEQTEEEQKTKEQERIAMLSLTAADVERGIYKATGKDFEDVVALVQSLCDSSAKPQNDKGVILSDSEVSQALNIDIKALKIELKANNFYRGNPYVDSIGTLLGFSKEQLDMFFETNDYTKLLGV